MVPVSESNLSPLAKAALIAALVLFELLVFWLDIVTGEAVSLQPLFVIPVVVAGVLLGNVSLFGFCVLSSLLRVEGYRRSAFDGEIFPYLPNLAATFASVLIVGAAVVLARHYRDRFLAHHDNSVSRRVSRFVHHDD
jgi:hypothetical protein